MKYDVRIEFVPGKHLLIAGTLSRAQYTFNFRNNWLDKEAVLMIHRRYSILSSTSDKLKETKKW